MKNIFRRNGSKELDEAYARDKDWITDESMRKGPGNEYPTLSETAAVTVIERLIRVARHKVCIFGNLLQEEIFLSDRVLLAMGRFHADSPNGNIVILTNDPIYSKEGFASLPGYGIDAQRVSVTPIPKELCSAYRHRFVLSDSREAYSYWLNKFAARSELSLQRSYFQFRGMSTGEDLKQCVDMVMVGPPYKGSTL